MELFAINRYTGDEPEKTNENQDALLQKLLEKVKKRKKELKKQQAKKKKDDEAMVVDGQPLQQPQSEVESAPLEQQSSAVSKDVPAEANAANETDDFKVLGDVFETSKKSQKVDMILPPWLSYPTVISTDISTANRKACKVKYLTYLDSRIRQAIKEMNIKKLFPVQMALIPWLINAHAKPQPFRPRDACVSAPTGSGKTLAFAVPIVQLLINGVKRKVRALVVLPVTELAQQVYEVFHKLCEPTHLKVCLLSKKSPFQQQQHELVEEYKGAYYSKVDIIVTTPGRLVDHLHATKGLCLRGLKFLVIDEADNIMDAAFQNWLYHLDMHVHGTSNSLLSGRVTSLCYQELKENTDKLPHKLLFSATLSQDPEKLQALRLFHPKLFTSVKIDSKDQVENSNQIATASDAAEAKSQTRGQFIGKYTTPAELTEKYCLTEIGLKPLTLYSLVTDNNWSKFLCFTNSAESSARLAFVLTRLFEKSVRISDLSALKSPMQRAQILSEFSRGKIAGLICSDALARGIDIPDVDIVISYDVPRHIKTYIHRIGRTGRAGRRGTAITILTQDEMGTFHQMLNEVGKHITEEITVSTLTEETRANSYAKALKTLRIKTEQTKQRKEIDKKRVKELAETAHKDPTQMTLMEKLQIQAAKSALQDADKPVETGPEKPPKRPKAKKFNPSAGKHSAIAR